jgi:hypothetical protein
MSTIKHIDLKVEGRSALLLLFLLNIKSRCWCSWKFTLPIQARRNIWLPRYSHSSSDSSIYFYLLCISMHFPGIVSTSGAPLTIFLSLPFFFPAPRALVSRQTPPPRCSRGFDWTSRKNGPTDVLRTQVKLKTEAKKIN